MIIPALLITFFKMNPHRALKIGFPIDTVLLLLLMGYLKWSK
jgi:hypothetical protein